MLADCKTNVFAGSLLGNLVTVLVEQSPVMAGLACDATNGVGGLSRCFDAVIFRNRRLGRRWLVE